MAAQAVVQSPQRAGLDQTSTQVGTPPTVEDSVDIQGRFPVLRVRYSLAMPPRWQAHSTWSNWPDVELARDPAAPSIRSLEIRDVPARIKVKE